MTQFVIVLGLPGTGKGTLASILWTSSDVTHISCGEVFRQHIKSGSEFGKRAAAYIAKGELTPDIETSEMFLAHIRTVAAATPIVLEGFPRTIDQARDFDTFLAQHSSVLKKVICLEASTEVLVNRLTGRRVCPECGRTYNIQTSPPRSAGVCDADGHQLEKRSDDRVEIIRPRLALYAEKELPVVRFYRDKDLLHTVNADAAPNVVAREVALLTNEAFEG